MAKRKNIRTRGKIKLSKYFQKFNEGESVAITREFSISSHFPKRMQGCTGMVEGKRGSVYIVRIKDQAKSKQFLVRPIHLKKIKQIKN